MPEPRGPEGKEAPGRALVRVAGGLRSRNCSALTYVLRRPRLEDLNEDAQQNFQPKLLTFVLKTLVKAPDLEAATSLVPSPLKAKLEVTEPA
ncbi:unnamed protein product [Durusdinium trenchii]|uniref:Uncharacterized protein n=1 Tax=Durusdinium trenchii TaxID=1381693 RepID=A0ABP0KQ83_9DINO